MRGKILVVDDSKTVLTFTKSMLQSAGFEVQVSDNVWITEQVRSFNPDLILMDLNFGKLKRGDLAITTVKKIFSHIKIFLYSSEKAHVLQETVKACAADGYICKTQSGDNLKRAVSRIMLRRASA